MVVMFPVLHVKPEKAGGGKSTRHLLASGFGGKLLGESAVGIAADRRADAVAHIVKDD